MERYKGEPVKRTICEWCKALPAIGVLRLPDEPAANVCQRCVPNSPMFNFQVYSWLVN